MNKLAGFNKKLGAASLIAAAFALAAPQAHAILIYISQDNAVLIGGSGPPDAVQSGDSNNPPDLGDAAKPSVGPNATPAAFSNAGETSIKTLLNSVISGLGFGFQFANEAAVSAALTGASWRLYGAAGTVNPLTGADPGTEAGFSIKTLLDINTTSPGEFPTVDLTANVTWEIASSGGGNLPGTAITFTATNQLNATANTGALCAAGTQINGGSDCVITASDFHPVSGLTSPNPAFVAASVATFQGAGQQNLQATLSGQIITTTSDGGAFNDNPSYIYTGSNTGCLGQGNPTDDGADCSDTGPATMRLLFAFDCPQCVKNAPIPATPLLVAGGLALLGLSRRRLGLAKGA